MALLRTARRLPFETVLTTLINDLAQLGHRGVLVLEDYHVITSPPIHEAMTYLVDHLPEMLHLLILTRSDPPLPLARLRAHNDLYELHAADLRFSLEETRTFLGQALPFPLSPEAIRRLEARTEGWVAGLRLLTLALQGRKDPRDLEHMLVTFTGSHRHILEYLVADVLSSQPEALQEFLLQTVFLNRLTGSLCDTVTGRNDSERMLEQLDHANLFLIPLDDSGQWYRYHALFAEAMQQESRRRLGQDYLRSLYDKASRWYEEHGLLAEAVEVALSVRDFARAAALIERIIGPRSINSELHTALSMAYAIALLFTLDRSDPATNIYIQAPLEMAERYWQAEDNRPKLAEVLALRSQLAWWQGDLHAAARFYQQEIAEAAEDPQDMATALIGLAALSYEWNELQRAEQEVSQALDLGKHHVDEIGKYHAEQLVQVPGSLILARVLNARGEILQAIGLLQEMDILTQERRWLYLHREVLAEEARLQLSVADLSAVQRWSTTIAQLGEDFRLVQQEREALIVARLRIAQGEAEVALGLLDHWLADARAQRRSRSELEILVLKALAHFSTNKHLPLARQKLREALTLAQAEGYRRLFLDEGEAMAILLRTVLLDLREEPLITYAQNLLRAFPQIRAGQVASPPAASELLIEPLSGQEQRVLRLLAAGRSNPEIAQELIVSVNTVKTQVQSIYRKLNVKSRMEAGEAARRLKLI